MEVARTDTPLSPWTREQCITHIREENRKGEMRRLLNPFGVKEKANVNQPSVTLTYQQIATLTSIGARIKSDTQTIADRDALLSVIDSLTTQAVSHVVRPFQEKEDAHNSKAKRLTWESVREMRHLYATTRTSMRGLAQQFGVSQTTVDRVVNHHTWKEDRAEPQSIHTSVRHAA